MRSPANAGHNGAERPTHPPRHRPTPAPIELHEPPSYIRIVSEEGEPITFYAQQRRYVRIETDANSNYHNANNPAASRINLIATNSSVLFRGSTTLHGGRLRAIFEGASDATVGQMGTIRVELNRPGLPALSDERPSQIVPTPPARPAARAVTLPPFDHRLVEGPADPLWATLAWPDNINGVASSAEMENGTLMIYYSAVFPRYAGPLAMFERRDPAQARSFNERYKIWLAVHSLFLYQDQAQGAAGAHGRGPRARAVANETVTAETFTWALDYLRATRTTAKLDSGCFGRSWALLPDGREDSRRCGLRGQMKRSSLAERLGWCRCSRRPAPKSRCVRQQALLTPPAKLARRLARFRHGRGGTA